MNIAVLSDIHSNYLALQECLHYALERHINTFFFLGDYLGDLAYPQRTMEILYELNQQYTCYFIKGNKENYWIDYRRSGEQGWKEIDSTTGCLLYTYNHLSDKDIGFFETLPHQQEITIPDMPTITICHGSPYSVNEKLLPNDPKTCALLEKHPTSFILCGHTHHQMKIEQNSKTIYNPGSVGMPLHSNGKAQFLILHETDHAWQEEFISLEYNVTKVVSELQEAGLDRKAPFWCKVTEKILQKGDISHGTVLAKAMSLCEQENGVCNWPDIPEQYWERVLSAM